MQCSNLNDDLGDVFDYTPQEDVQNMNDDLMLEDEVSSSDEEVPYCEPPPEAVVQPKSLEQIVSDCLSKNLKNEFEIF